MNDSVEKALKTELRPHDLEKLYKLRYISSKIREKWYVRNIFLPPPPPPPTPTILGKEILISKLKCPSGKTSATPFGRAKRAHTPPPRRNTEVTS